MKDTLLTKVVDEVVSQELEIVDFFVEKFIEPLGEVGNPEELIDKDYESMTPDDLQRLTQIYGTGDKTPLANLIFKRILERVQRLEADELKAGG